MARSSRTTATLVVFRLNAAYSKARSSRWEITNTTRMLPDSACPSVRFVLSVSSGICGIVVHCCNFVKTKIQQMAQMSEKTGKEVRTTLRMDEDLALEIEASLEKRNRGLLGRSRLSKENYICELIRRRLTDIVVPPTEDLPKPANTGIEVSLRELVQSEQRQSVRNLLVLLGSVNQETEVLIQKVLRFTHGLISSTESTPLSERSLATATEQAERIRTETGSSTTSTGDPPRLRDQPKHRKRGNSNGAA